MNNPTANPTAPSKYHRSCRLIWSALPSVGDANDHERGIFQSGFIVVVVLALAASSLAATDSCAEFQLVHEQALDDYGGVPFCCDLDQDGRTDILWLQSPGIFHAAVFDKILKGRLDNAGRSHFCLTATNARGKILWRIGKPWRGQRPFVTHGAERSIDCADIDGDGTVEVVCARGDELLVIDGVKGTVERSTRLPADNGQIVVLGRTGPSKKDWTILVKNGESAYKPHEYANPAWFFDSDLTLLKTADYLGAGHVPQAADVDGDGLDEFLIGFNLVGSNLETVWRFQPVPPERWSAGEMHVDDIALGRFGDRTYIAYAASDTTFLLDASDGRLLWKHTGVHPQHCQVGHFVLGRRMPQILVRNKRSNNQLFDAEGTKLWEIDPPENFPLGKAEPCKRMKFHVFDPTTILPKAGPAQTDLLIYTDGGWPYVIGGDGRQCGTFPTTANVAQDWGKVPGRPDDFGYGYYARVADFDGDGQDDVMLNDRRFAWFYHPTNRSAATAGTTATPAIK